MAGLVGSSVPQHTGRMDANAEGDRAAGRIFTPRRPTKVDLSGEAGMDALSWFARTSADPPSFRLRVGLVIFENVAVFRLAHSRSVLDRTAAHVAAVSLGRVFYVVSTGAVVVSQNGRDIPLGSGSAAIVSGSSPHQLRIPESAETILAVVRKGVFHGRGLLESEPEPRRFPTTSFTEAVSQFLWTLSLDPPDPFSPEGITSQQAILSLLTGLVVGSSEDPQRSAPSEMWIANALTFIAANYANPSLTTADVAAATGISSRHLQRVFASADNSVADELRRTRVRWATTSLEQPEGVRKLEELAASTGFGTAARMKRAFLRQMGMSPQEYRASLRENSGRTI